LDIIYLIRDTIDTIISIKVKDQIQQLMISKDEFKNCRREYEELLRQEEAEIRRHICTQHQRTQFTKPTRKESRGEIYNNTKIAEDFNNG
jgi:hypothetical protein